ncbi:MAG: hypothetical protein NTY53_15830 [Kiritimatiellaeota bacterium]|nr:hypothetical protein [Kiritimatiellota bacterium]
MNRYTGDPRRAALQQLKRNAFVLFCAVLLWILYKQVIWPRFHNTVTNAVPSPPPALPAQPLPR